MLGLFIWAFLLTLTIPSTKGSSLHSNNLNLLLFVNALAIGVIIKKSLSSNWQFNTLSTHTRMSAVAPLDSGPLKKLIRLSMLSLLQSPSWMNSLQNLTRKSLIYPDLLIGSTTRVVLILEIDHIF
jgi:hypothetical protein